MTTHTRTWYIDGLYQAGITARDLYNTQPDLTRASRDLIGPVKVLSEVTRHSDKRSTITLFLPWSFLYVSLFVSCADRRMFIGRSVPSSQTSANVI